MTPARYHGLDLLRAAMMLLGVVIHIAISYMESPAREEWPLRDPERSGLAGLLVLAVHTFRMPAFFALSGFFGALVVTRKGLAHWVTDRLWRIAFPFILAWLVLFPVVKFAFIFSITRGMQQTGDGAAIPALIAAALADPWSNPQPMHLWFLQYLLMLCGLAALAWLGSRALPEKLRARLVERSTSLFAGWPGLLTLAALVILTCIPMRWMPIPAIATPVNFTPQPAILLCYAVFFFGGWILALDPRSMQSLLPAAWYRLGAGLVALVITIIPALMWFIAEGTGASKDDPGMRLLVMLTQASTALTAWLIILGGAGVAERLIRQPRPALRLLVDSSYWIYLFHLPVCIITVGLLIPWQAPGTLKMLVAFALTCLILAAGFAANAAIFPRKTAPRPTPTT